MNVWATRDEGIDGPLCTALRHMGLAVTHEPVVQRRVTSNAAEEIGRLTTNDWLVFTSAYALHAVAISESVKPRIAVVGKATRDAAQKRGLTVTLVGNRGSETLFDELRRQVVTGVVCYPRSHRSTPPTPWNNVELDCPVVYETTVRAFDTDVADRVDVVAVTSPSAVDAIGPVARPFASIGPTTSFALRRHGIEPWLEAPLPSFTSLAAAIADHSESQRA